MYKKERTAQQDRNSIENDTEQFRNNTNPRPPSCNNFLPDWNTCHRSIKKESNSRASLSASCAAHFSRDHLATDSVGVELSSLSATVRTVARLA